MNARVLASAALLLGSAAAPAQLTCTPGHLRAGNELHIGSPGAFGGSPSADVVLSYRNTAGGTAARFGSARSWSASEVVFLLPVDFAAGTYDVVLSSHAGALSKPSCFTVDPALVSAPLAPRTVVVGHAVPTVRWADADDPCGRTTTVSVGGSMFPAGVVVGYDLLADGPPPDGGWARYGFGPPEVRDAQHMVVFVYECFLARSHPKVRLRFPGGVTTEWVDIALRRHF